MKTVVTLNTSALRRVVQSSGVARDLAQRGEKVAQRQRELAPRGEGRHMADTIDARIARDDEGLVCYIGPWGDLAWYAWFPEYGTYNRVAQPFLRPSIDAAR